MDRREDIKAVLIENYMPYAKGTIIGRAIPGIDGLKPSNRRILYTMYTMGGLSGDKQKSSRIAGQVMKFHPHGDSSIYDTMIRMSEGNGSLNAPYIESKGNFGKAWSSMPYAASRYTEAKLSAICNEVFEGINENAVDMVDNFDNTEKEPALLPVKFPSVLVNTSSGIAVGKSSNIPPFNLSGVCNATIGLLDGSIENVPDLMNVLGAPEFPTGGYIHVDAKELIKLGTIGRGTFVVSGKVELYNDRIIIKEIPFNATIEDIVNDIKANMKTELKEVVSAKDLSGLNGLSATITLKRGANPVQVLKKITRFTKLRTQMTFNTSVVINNRCRTLGVMELLQEWIKFRIETLNRMYTYRLGVKRKEEYKLVIWEKLNGRLKEAVDIVASNPEHVAKSMLMTKFGLEEAQAEFVLDMKLRTITTDKAKKELAKLEEVRKTIKDYIEIIESEEKKKQLIISELKEISEKYGKERKCTMAKPYVEEKEDTEEEEVDDRLVTVILTKNGNVKRLISLRDFSAFENNPDDPEVARVNCRNNEELLFFTENGTCYKVKVNSIDASKGYPKEYVFSLFNNVDDNSKIIHVCAAKDYSGHFHVVYNSGKGRTVYLSKVAGNRSRYKNLFEPGSLTEANIVESDKFFLITKKRKAAYIDLTFSTSLGRRASFRVARVGDDDDLYGIQPVENVPNIAEVDIDKYCRGYCVKIKDKLW